MVVDTLESIKQGTYKKLPMKIKPSVDKVIQEVIEEVRSALETVSGKVLVNVYIKDGKYVSYLDGYGTATNLFPVSQWIGVANMVSMKGTLKEKLVKLLLDRIYDIVKDQLIPDLS